MTRQGYVAYAVLWLLTMTSPICDACLRTQRSIDPFPGSTETLSTRQTSGLQAALGGDIRAAPYTDLVTDEPISHAGDLSCNFASSCRWRNVVTETLDWSLAEGHADPLRWQFATQSELQPVEPFALLASNPRDPSENGQLISDSIECQRGDGLLTFRHWTSLSRDPGDEPQLELCVRTADNADLSQCQRVTNPSPGPTSFTIPGPLSGPFQFVLRGSHFTNEPEGGFMIIDDITYEADVTDDRAECHALLFSEAPTEPPTEPPTPAPTTPSTTTTSAPVFFDEESCRLVQCTFDLNAEFCQLNPFGDGAIGRGVDQGWLITTGRLNRANPLTGVRYDYQRSRDGAFAVADFPDPRQERINPGMKYVLETPVLSFGQEQFLHFKRYLATEGTQLRVCRDADGFDCVFESEPLVRGQSNAIANRNWIDEILPLPPGEYSLYFVASYDTQRRYNAGQVGISFIHFYKDRNLRDPLC